MEEAKNLKQEVVGLKDQLKTIEKLKKGTKALNKFLSLQIFPSNKYGLGYDQVHMVKGSSPITHIDVEDDKCCDDISKEKTIHQRDGNNAKSYAQESSHPPTKSNLKRNSNHKKEDQKILKYESTIPPTFNTNKKELTNKFIFTRSPQMFRGYCYSCNNYGHKASEFQAY